MARRSKSLLGSIVSTAVFGAAAASLGYVAYKAVQRKDSRSSGKLAEKSAGKSQRSSSTSKKSAKKSSSTRPVSSDKPKAAVKREKQVKAPKTPPAKKKVSKDHLQWLPGLRAREQKILNSMSTGKSVKMADISRNFPHVTVRTLRRDMDRLVAKGRVRKDGTTRSTTYIKT